MPVAPVRSTTLPERSAGPLTTVKVTGRPELALAVRAKEPLLLVRSASAAKVIVWFTRLIVSASLVVLVSLEPALLLAVTAKR